MKIDSAINSIDIFTRYKAFWKSAVIRNTHPTDKVQFRVNVDDELQDVQPNSELPLKGWGSFLQVVSSAVLPIGVVDFECVNMAEAMRKNAK